MGICITMMECPDFITFRHDPRGFNCVRYTYTIFPLGSRFIVVFVWVIGKHAYCCSCCCLLEYNPQDRIFRIITRQTVQDLANLPTTFALVSSRSRSVWYAVVFVGSFKIKFTCFHFIENNIIERNVHGNNYS